MNFRPDGLLKSLVMPGGLLLGIAAGIVQSGALRSAGTVIDFFYFTAFGVGLLLAWRFHSSRVASALVVLILGHHAIEFFAQGRVPLAGPGLTAFEAVSFLVPLNFVLLAISRERGVTLAIAVPRLALLFVQSVFVAVICRPSPSPGARLFHGTFFGRTWSAWTPIPQIALLVFVAVFGYLIVRLVSRPKPVENGFAWALLALFLALNIGGIGPAARAYVASAAIILVVSIIETSYAMAYHDELTGLPSRRAFNDATLQLQAPYTVAGIDIDHFKSVNDTFGHETGDEVLCMVAANLARVTGGGQPFRVGGEEFTILFPGKSSVEVMEHVEMLRQIIQESPFRLRRNTDRRSAPRGPDRRSSGQKKNTRTKARAHRGSLQVTVSIGVAEPHGEDMKVEEVLKLADQALYAAKRGGRNRVEVAGAAQKRSKRKGTQNIA
ncbi:MAG TPA: GGDEF domain-containing protein [Terriglobales bacterium]|nr:GGDEF domain-containing protein [Terriglobales bacterium]